MEPTQGRSRIHSADVVLFTVNRHETSAVNSEFALSSSARPFGERNYWDLGNIGGNRVFHAITQTGDQATDAAARAAVSTFAPKLIICVGLAWGAKPKEYKLGDILLATKLHDWAHRKESAEDGVIPRGYTIPVSDALLQSVKTSYLDWNPGSETGKPKLRDGLMLSNPVLYDDAIERDKALNTHPEAIGGEMEGRGLVWVAQQEKRDWLVIKAICDWGYGKNAPGVDKEKAQRSAAEHSAQFVRYFIQNNFPGSHFATLRSAGRQRKHAAMNGNTETIEQLAREFVVGRNDVIGNTRRRDLQSLLARLDELKDGSFDEIALRARIWRDLARDSRTLGDLSDAWQNTIESLERCTRVATGTADSVEAWRMFVEASVDFAQTGIPSIGLNYMYRTLNSARKHIGQKIGPSPRQGETGSNELGDLLLLRAKCSRALAGLLRRRAGSSRDVSTKVDRHKNDALRDAEDACDTAPNEMAVLELALCLFAKSATPKSDFAVRAMELLEEAVAAPNVGVLIRYELTKQYRLRYRFLDAIEVFRKIKDRDSRRFHENVTHFAASVIGLHYEREESAAQENAGIGISWLEELISFDHHQARDVVDLCYLKAIAGSPFNECVATLTKLHPKDSSVWDEIAEMATKVSKGDELGYGLLLGLEQSVIWSRIGSFFGEFGHDFTKAVGFYDKAIQITPTSPVYRFNKAEALAYGQKRYTEASRCLGDAMRLKHRSYAWYRSIPEKIRALENEIAENS